MESMREKYESLSAAAIKELAKARGLRHISGLRKSEVIERMLEADTKENGSDGSVSQPEEKKENREVRANKGNSGNNNSNNSSNNGGSNNTSNNITCLQAKTAYL